MEGSLSTRSEKGWSEERDDRWRWAACSRLSSKMPMRYLVQADGLYVFSACP